MAINNAVMDMMIRTSNSVLMMADMTHPADVSAARIP